MKKISSSLEEIINANPLLRMGLHHRILNLTSLAKIMKPLIEVRTKKDLQSSSALVMALSRFQREQKKKIPKIEKFSITNMTIHSNLYIATYAKNQKFLEQLGKVYHEVQKKAAISL